MTGETYDELGFYIGENKSIPNHLWIQLISECFGVSKTVARKMLHMYGSPSVLQNWRKPDDN